MLREQQVEPDRVIEAITSALKADGDKLLSQDEQKTIVGAIEHLIVARNSDDRDAIEASIKVVDQATQEFANRRMDKSINAALTGKSVGDI